MKFHMLHFPFLLLCVLVLSCLNEDYLKFQNTFKSLKGKKEISVVIVGDSISGQENSVTGSSYGTFLKPKLEKLLNTRVSMINSSRPEDTVDKVSRRIQEDIQSFRPDVVFIMLGMVDSTLPQLLEQDYEGIAGNYFKKLEREGIFAVVVTSTGYRDWVSGNDERRIRLREFNDITMYRATMAHLPVLDLGEHIDVLRRTKPDEYRSLFQDDIHLSEKGQMFVADYLYNQIERALKEK
ncbi:MAG: SGNH/GDSL hydrolase family protein [Candidatus Latescibacterota bacterium]